MKTETETLPNGDVVITVYAEVCSNCGGWGNPTLMIEGLHCSPIVFECEECGRIWMYLENLDS